MFRTWFARKPSVIYSPIGRLAFGFAVLAAGTSSMGAYFAASTLGLSGLPGQIAIGVLVFVSVMMVSYERSSLPAIRARRAREDYGAAWAGIALLVVACLYTMIMQLTVYGSMFLGAAAKDHAQTQSISDTDKRIAELEKESSWKLVVFAHPDALRAEIAGLEKQMTLKGKEFADSRAKAAAALPEKRAALSAVLRKQQIDQELSELRAKNVDTMAEAPADAKTKVIAALIGILGISAAGNGVTMGLIVLAVMVTQMGQILLPSIAGKSEFIAARAAAVNLTPQAEVEIVEVKPAPPAIIDAQVTEVKQLPPPPNPLGGALTQRAIEMQREQKEAAERMLAQQRALAEQAKLGKPKKAPSKPVKAAPPPPPAAPPRPVRKGLASRIS